MSGKTPVHLLIGRLLAALLILGLLLFPGLELARILRWVLPLVFAWVAGEIWEYRKPGLRQDVPALMGIARHSFLNHLQVLSGWFQTGRQDRAIKYLSTARDRITQETKALSISHNALRGMVLEVLGSAGSRDLPMRLEVVTSRPWGWPLEAIGFALEFVLQAAGDGGIELTVDELRGRFHVCCQGTRWTLEQAQSAQNRGRTLVKGPWLFEVGDGETDIVIRIRLYRWWRRCS